MTSTYKRATNHLLRDSGEIKQTGTVAKATTTATRLRCGTGPKDLPQNGLGRRGLATQRHSSKHGSCFSVTSREAHRTNFLFES